MKTVKIWPIKGTNISVCQLQFTQKEKGKLLEVLQKYEQKAVFQFINKLESLCHSRYSILKRQEEKESVYRAELQRMLKSFKGALRHVDRVAECEIVIGHRYTIKRTKAFASQGIADNPPTDLSYETIKVAREINEPLKRLITMIESYLEETKRKRGRPLADDTDFIKSIADLFAKYLGTPRGYKGGKEVGSGPFFEVVKVALKTLGLPSDDPSRGVGQAL